MSDAEKDQFGHMIERIGKVAGLIKWMIGLICLLVSGVFGTAAYVIGQQYDMKSLTKNQETLAKNQEMFGANQKMLMTFRETSPLISVSTDTFNKFTNAITLSISSHDNRLQQVENSIISTNRSLEEIKRAVKTP